MNKLEKAQAQLESIGISASIQNHSIYVAINGSELQLSDFEINYQVERYNEEN